MIRILGRKKAHREGSVRQVRTAILALGLPKALLNPLEGQLWEEGYAVIPAAGMDTARWLVENRRFGLVVLCPDVFLSEEGRELLNRLRQDTFLPALVLQGTGRARREVPAGYDADLCLSMDLPVCQIAAFLTALLRQQQLEWEEAFEQGADQIPILQGDFFLDPGKNWGMVGDRIFFLEPGECLVLRLFLEHPHQVLSQQWMTRRLWSVEYGADLEEIVASLDEKLRGPGRPACYIQALEGYGYRFHDVPLPETAGGRGGGI